MEIPFLYEKGKRVKNEISVFHWVVTTDHNPAFRLASQEAPSGHMTLSLLK